MRRIKLIWEFGGSDSLKVAEHHVIHLNEFAKKENLSSPYSGVEQLNEIKSIAYLVVDESVVFKVRDALKPLRAEIV